MELFRRDDAAVAEQRPAPGRERRRRINPLTKQRVFIRNLQAGAKLQSFLVAAVTSILVIRLFLEITGYPQPIAQPTCELREACEPSALQ